MSVPFDFFTEVLIGCFTFENVTIFRILDTFRLNFPTIFPHFESFVIFGWMKSAHN